MSKCKRITEDKASDMETQELLRLFGRKDFDSEALELLRDRIWDIARYRLVVDAEELPHGLEGRCAAGCVWFFPLEQGFLPDFGVCLNTASPHRGRLLYEHCGCDMHSGVG